MNLLNLCRFFLLSIVLIFSCSCASLGSNKAQWENLPERKFYLTEFQYIHTGKDSDNALKVMKSFPVKKLMYILSREYNIEIDMSDFCRLTKDGTSSEIKADGLIRNEKLTWKSQTQNNMNTLSVKFQRDYFDEKPMRLLVNAKSGNKTINSITIEFTKMDYLFSQLDFFISETDKYAAEFDTKKYEEKNEVPGLIMFNNSSQISTVNDRLTEIKSLINEYVKSLDNEQKKAFKHEIIDHIYKICD